MALRDIPAGIEVHGALPVRVSARQRSAAILFTAQLTGPEAEQRQVARRELPAANFTEGGEFQFALPHRSLAPGFYRLRVEASVGNELANRDVAFTVVPNRHSRVVNVPCFWVRRKSSGGTNKGLRGIDGKSTASGCRSGFGRSSGSVEMLISSYSINPAFSAGVFQAPASGVHFAKNHRLSRPGCPQVTSGR